MKNIKILASSQEEFDAAVKALEAIKPHFALEADYEKFIDCINKIDSTYGSVLIDVSAKIAVRMPANMKIEGISTLVFQKGKESAAGVLVEFSIPGNEEVYTLRRMTSACVVRFDA